MREWAPIDIADALELLSPDFVNEKVRSLRVSPFIAGCLPTAAPDGTQVRSHAVEVLGRADDEELRYYLLQLVQVLLRLGICALGDLTK
jgi:HEAT repeat protein